MTKKVAIVLFLLSCSSAPPPPESIPAGAVCGGCRMLISDARLAAQIVAPGEETIFFDDIGCLRSHQKASTAIAYVADYRTGAWIDAAAASYLRCESIETPMGSHIIAAEHADTLPQCPTPEVAP